jgi:hypothetical protein
VLSINKKRMRLQRNNGEKSSWLRLFWEDLTLVTVRWYLPAMNNGDWQATSQPQNTGQNFKTLGNEWAGARHDTQATYLCANTNI